MEQISFQGATTNDRGQTVQGPVPVSSATPMPVDIGSASAGIAQDATLQTISGQLAVVPNYLPATPILTTNDTTPFLLDSTANTDITIAAAGGANVKTRLYFGQITVTGAATTLKIYDDASATGNVVWRRDVPSTGGIIDILFTGREWCKSQANKALVLKQTGGAQLSGTLNTAQSTVA